MKKKIYIFECENGRTFESWASSFERFGSTFLVNMWVREVIRPNRRFFRTRLIDYGTFLLCDYSTVEDGIKKTMLRIIGDLFADEKEVAKINTFLGK